MRYTSRRIGLLNFYFTFIMSEHHYRHDFQDYLTQKMHSEQVCQSSLLSDQNARWPRR